jgi:hypothetical protein
VTPGLEKIFFGPTPEHRADGPKSTHEPTHEPLIKTNFRLTARSQIFLHIPCIASKIKEKEQK